MGSSEPSTKPIAGENVQRDSNLEPTATHATNASGQYTFMGDAGNVTLTPAQVRLLTDDTECRSAITASDATQIARSAALLITLTSNQRVAADVSNNGTVSGFDAALVAQRAVATSCIDYHFPVRNATGSDWAFRPVSKSYTPLHGGENYDFVGVLYGDVTGNWAPLSLLASAAAASK